VLVGRVERFDEQRGEAIVRLTKPVAAGDVVYLYTSWGQTEPTRLDETGGDRVTLRVRERVAVKDRLFRLAAAGVDRMARDLVAGRTALRPVGLRMSLSGEGGAPARLRVWQLDDDPGGDGGTSLPPIEVESAVDLAPARTAALSVEKARDALGALGGTPYTLAELEFGVAPGTFLGVADVKDMRRRAVAALGERRLAARRRSAQGVSAGNRRARPASRKSVRPPPAGLGDGRDIILRLRPDERPVVAAGVGALCLDLFTGDPPGQVARALARLTPLDLPVRCRPPEVIFDTDLEWLAAVIDLPWSAVQVRHLGLAASVVQKPVVLECPLQGLNGLAAGVAAGLAGRPPAAVVASPEASLDEIVALMAGLARLDPAPAVEVVAFGRQQVLHTRDQLGRAEGLVDALGPAEHRELLLEDTKGYVFPAQVDAGGTRLFNARVTNLAAQLDELRDAGVSGFAVVQADLDRDEGRAFASGGLPALARFATRERSTTGHLFRGVA
jgi:putative protease